MINKVDTNVKEYTERPTIDVSDYTEKKSALTFEKKGSIASFFEIDKSFLKWFIFKKKYSK
jgi:hypothetical protein